jgi:glutamate formiminotransferase
MNRIVECVPNFSEGRRPEVIDTIVNAMTTVPDVYILGREMDFDHNRAVVTFIGSPESVCDAAFRGVEVAAQHIDLTQHLGEHPRMGATDVLPFVPIRGVTLAECIEIARNVGRRIGDELHIPVYLYEAAATRPDRAPLENVRRGQFEGLRREIGVNPERAPDFGKTQIHPTAGAIAVGARKPLIAYNINLNTPDIKVAREIAKRIRFSSGGFRYVKAMGVLLKDRNQAQVSMNLTDFEQTPIELVFETVRREAERFGVAVAGSEIVGLIPQRALDEAAEFFLRVENFRPQMVLESRIDDVTSHAAPRPAESLRTFVERVASPDPTPAGGSVAALSGALGVGLGEMAIAITQNKKGREQHARRYKDALTHLAPFKAEFLRLIEADSEAYNQVIAAHRLPKESASRDGAIQNAWEQATETPAQTARYAAEALKTLEEIQSLIHPNVASDLEVGAEMLRTAMRGAISNMRANLDQIKDAARRRQYADLMATWEQTLSKAR